MIPRHLPQAWQLPRGVPIPMWLYLFCRWRSWSCWWCRLVVPRPRHRLTIIEGWSSLLNPQICSQTHPFESIFILTILILQVIDLGLEALDFLMKLEDGLPNVLDVQLVVVGELCDHNVIGVKSTLHHLLTLQNFLLQCLEPCLRASGLPWSLNIADVQQPLSHLNGLRVLQHLCEVRVDDILEKLVLGGAWRRHGVYIY